ncbi:MAG: ABC transporter permease [Defluviitaleaceae bacterium]|nr:ABC transporter permease [Defluviitaleaceae bacterium]
MSNILKRGLNFSVSIVLLLLFWQIVVVVGQHPEHLMPSPARVALALKELFTDGRLFEHVLISLWRFFAGYFAACLLAAVLGTFLGWFKLTWKLIEPIVLLIKPISPIAWLPFIMLWFGIGDAPAIFTIALAAFFPMLLATVKSINSINESFIKVADNFGLTKFQTLFKIILPASFPLLVEGLHTALTSAWIFLVAGELMGTHSGLGFLINDARQNLRSDLIMAGIVLIGVMGYILDKILDYVERYVSQKWGV